MDPTGPVSYLSTLLTNVGSFVTAAIGWMEDIIESITTTGNELLLVGFIMGIAGFAIGLIRRITRAL